MLKSFCVWAHMIVSAAIGSAATSISVMLVDPSKFNWSHDGLIETAKVAGIGAIIGVAGVLKQSPLPNDGDCPTCATGAKTQ